MTFSAEAREIPLWLADEAMLRVNLASLIRRCGHELRSTKAPWISEGLCPYCDAEEGFLPGSAPFVVLDRRDDAPEIDPAAVHTASHEERARLIGLIPRYKCRSPRGCAAMGNALGFWMRWHNVGYRAAVRALCDEAGITYYERIVDKPAQGVCEHALDLMLETRAFRAAAPGEAWRRAARLARSRNEESRQAGLLRFFEGRG